MFGKCNAYYKAANKVHIEEWNY